MYGLSIVDGAKRVCRGFKNDQFKQKFTLKKSKNFKIHKIEDPLRYDCSAYCQDHFYVWLVIVDGAKRVCRGFKNDQFKQKFTLKKSKNFKSTKSKIRLDTIVQPIARIIFMYGLSIVDGAKRVCRGFKNDQFKQKFTLKKSKNFKSTKSKIRSIRLFSLLLGSFLCMACHSRWRQTSLPWI